MRILLSSHRFDPDIGGIETCSQLLAGEFVRAGHQVVVDTKTAGKESRPWPFPVERQPSSRALLRLVRECDLVFHNHISLQTAWPLLFVRRPWVVATHNWLSGTADFLNWMGRTKQFLLRFAHNLYISQPIARHVGHPGVIVGDPYDNATFRPISGIPRERDIVFLGRLVSDKGCDLLIEALRRLQEQGLSPSTTIIGDGPERETLEQAARERLPAGAVQFLGKRSGEELARELNRHRFLVVPSRWQEPFGIVALEGLACGCVPIVSSGGGLPEAIGPCGATFPNGDAGALAAVLAEWLNDRPRQEAVLRLAEEHLREYQVDRVAAKYLAVFEGVLGRG